MPPSNPPYWIKPQTLVTQISQPLSNCPLHPTKCTFCFTNHFYYQKKRTLLAPQNSLKTHQSNSQNSQQCYSYASVLCKDKNEQPDEKVHRERNKRVPGTEESLPMVSGNTTLPVDQYVLKLGNLFLALSPEFFYWGFIIQTCLINSLAISLNSISSPCPLPGGQGMGQD